MQSSVKIIRLKYQNESKFIHDFKKILTGTLLIECKSDFALGASVKLELFIPRFKSAHFLKMFVTKCKKTENPDRNSVTLIVGEDSIDGLTNVVMSLRGSNYYRNIFKQEAPIFFSPGVSIEVINQKVIANVMENLGEDKKTGFKIKSFDRKKQLQTIGAQELAEKIATNPDAYLKLLTELKDKEERKSIVNAFKRVIPALIENRDASNLERIVKKLNSFPGKKKTGIINFLFQDEKGELAGFYETASKTEHAKLDKLFLGLGPLGVEILVIVLNKSGVREVRESSINVLISMGSIVSERFKEILEDNNQEWYMRRNAILIFGQTNSEMSDSSITRRYLHDDHPRIREEALFATINIEGKGAETLLLNAMSDPEYGVQMRAVQAFRKIGAPSKSTVRYFVNILMDKPPVQEVGKKYHEQKVCEIIKSLTYLSDSLDKEYLEKALITAAKMRLKKLVDSENTQKPDEEGHTVLNSIIKALPKVGGDESHSFLSQLASTGGPFKLKARRACKKIESSNIDSAAG
jgi:HEAT repeat protein